MEDSFWTWVESLRRTFTWGDPAVEKEGHVGSDEGAHHVLPGWGQHPESFEESASDELDEAHEQGERPKALIGQSRGRKVWFDPDLPQAHLANAHMTITGESGSGKTQAMKTILADLHFNGVPALVLDFKDDYAEKRYAAKEGFQVFDPTRRPLPFNPLEPSVDPQTGEANKTFHTYQLVEILGRIYHLGELQQHSLREAIKATYADAGEVIPTFDSVKDKLQSSKGNNELLGHLAPIFDFGFFSDPNPIGFDRLAAGNTVIRLAQLPGGEVKNSVAEFFLMALYNYLVRFSQTHLLRQVLVLDEAWRVVDSPFLEPLMREARAFGLGVFVGTQFPTDLPLAVQGSAATALYFSQSNPDQVAEVERTILGGTSGSEAMRLGTTIRSMLPLQCIVHNRQYDPWVQVDARPYYARYQDKEASIPRIDWLELREVPRNSGEANFNLTKGMSYGAAPPKLETSENDWGFPEYEGQAMPEGGLDNAKHLKLMHPEIDPNDEDELEEHWDEGGTPFHEHCHECGKPVEESIDSGMCGKCASEDYEQKPVCAEHGSKLWDWNSIPHRCDKAEEVWATSSPPKEGDACPMCDATGRNHQGAACKTCKGSGIWKGLGSKNSWELGCYFPEDEKTAKVADKVNPHTPQAEDDRVQYWKEHSDPVKNYDDGTWHDPKDRKYVEQVDGKYTCQCGFATDNEPREEDNWQPLCDYCRTIGNLSGMHPQGDDPSASRVDRYRDWWKEAHKVAGRDGASCIGCGGSGLEQREYEDGNREYHSCSFCKGDGKDTGVTYGQLGESRFEDHPSGGKVHVQPPDIMCLHCGNGPYSGNRADYWNAPDDKEITCDECGGGMRLVVPRTGFDIVGRVSRDCYNGNHSDCNTSSCTCSHHDPINQYSGSCAEGDHDKCRMDGCPCPCGHSVPGGACRWCGGSGITNRLEMCENCEGSGVEAGKLKTAEIVPFPPGKEHEGEGPFDPFSMSEWQMVKGPKLRRNRTGSLDDEPWEECVDCGGDGKDKGLYDDVCDVHGGSKIDDKNCLASNGREACKFTSNKGKECGNCKGSGLMPSDTTCPCGHGPDDHGVTRGGCISCLSQGRPLGPDDEDEVPEDGPEEEFGWDDLEYDEEDDHKYVCQMYRGGNPWGLTGT